MPVRVKVRGRVKPGPRFAVFSEQVNAPTQRPSSALAQAIGLASANHARAAAVSFEWFMPTPLGEKMVVKMFLELGG
jgi:hypothetical protein